MVTSFERERCLRIARQVVSGYARDRVASALYEAAIDGLEFGPRDLPLQDDREWIRGAIAVPLQEATDVALDAFVWSLARSLASAPDGLLDRYERSHLERFVA